MEPLADAGGFLLFRASLARGRKEALMACVPVPDDLNRVRARSAFNLTKRMDRRGSGFWKILDFYEFQNMIQKK